MAYDFNDWLKSFTTTTSLVHPVLPIGRLRGDNGSSSLPDLPLETPKLPPGASLRALFAPGLASKLSSKTVYDPSTDNYRHEIELAGDVDPAELDHARAIVAGAMQPCSETVIKHELTRMRLMTSHARITEDDLMLALAIYAEELAAYPENVVVAACRKRWGFWPNWEELGGALDKLMAEQRQVADAVARGPTPVDPEEEAWRRDYAADRARAYAEAAAWRATQSDVSTERREPLRDIGAELAEFRARMAAFEAGAAEEDTAA